MGAGAQEDQETTMDTTNTITAKTRTITLTDGPVKIREDEWPVIAKGTGDSYTGNDCARHQQASARGELDEYSIRVRRHADGRVLVYAVFEAASAWTGSEDHRCGVLLPSGADLAATIREVGEEAGIPARVIRECIASLPAVEL